MIKCILNKDHEHIRRIRSYGRIQFAFKGKREHIAKINIPNIAYPNQHIDIDIPHGSRDHIIIPDIIKIMFNLDINQQTRYVVL